MKTKLYHVTYVIAVEARNLEEAKQAGRAAFEDGMLDEYPKVVAKIKKIKQLK